PRFAQWRACWTGTLTSGWAGWSGPSFRRVHVRVWAVGTRSSSWRACSWKAGLTLTTRSSSCAGKPTRLGANFISGPTVNPRCCESWSERMADNPEVLPTALGGEVKSTPMEYTFHVEG